MSEEEPTLGVLVARLTRQAPDAVLVSMVVVGIVGAAALLLFAPTWWRVLPPFALLFSAGCWGIAERERAHDGVRGMVFRVVRGIALLGSLAAVATLILVFMGTTLGRWIS